MLLTGEIYGLIINHDIVMLFNLCMVFLLNHDTLHRHDYI